MTTTKILGFAATGLVIVGYIPQIVHLIKERCTAGISISAFSLWCTASLLFLIHASMIGDAVFVGAQTVNLVAGGLIVGFCPSDTRARSALFIATRIPGFSNTSQAALRGRSVWIDHGRFWRSRESTAFQNDTNISE
jgi:uncharacterized protein with PQ loop repeat